MIVLISNRPGSRIGFLTGARMTKLWPGLGSAVLGFWPGPGLAGILGRKCKCDALIQTIWYTSEQQILNTSGSEENLGIYYSECGVFCTIKTSSYI